MFSGGIGWYCENCEHLIKDGVTEEREEWVEQYDELWRNSFDYHSDWSKSKDKIKDFIRQTRKSAAVEALKKLKENQYEADNWNMVVNIKDINHLIEEIEG